MNNQVISDGAGFQEDPGSLMELYDRYEKRAIGPDGGRDPRNVYPQILWDPIGEALMDFRASGILKDSLLNLRDLMHFSGASLQAMHRVHTQPCDGIRRQFNETMPKHLKSHLFGNEILCSESTFSSYFRMAFRLCWQFENTWVAEPRYTLEIQEEGSATVERVEVPNDHVVSIVNTEHSAKTTAQQMRSFLFSSRKKTPVEIYAGASQLMLQMSIFFITLAKRAIDDRARE